jgi:hypothetical protein
MGRMTPLRAFLALFLTLLSMSAAAQIVPSPRFDELERRLKIRPEQKEQFDMAVGATKRALLAVGLSFMEMKQKLAEELLKPSPDFSRLFDNADKVFEMHQPLFRDAGREWKKLHSQLDDEQVQIVKRFLLDNLGQWGAMPFLDDAPSKPQPKARPKAAPKIPSEEWI